MRQLETIAGMKTACRSVTHSGQVLGLVPTMGALHEGHLSLVRAARSQCEVTAVSIFVNPLQFAPNEDFQTYPRTVERDVALLQELGVDLLFLPSAAEMYPPGASTYVEVSDLSGKLDGGSRPGHFRGVATVVFKLFEIVRPDRAYFGQKDAAQVANLRKMVRDLDMDVEIVVCPIVREPDGLALSSRNAYLNAEQRRQALVLSRALQQVKSAVDAGERDARKLAEIGVGVITSEPAAKLDYFAVVDPDTLEPVDHVRPGILVAVAAWLGTTRLIDNMLL
ncbi:MAG TPA: pantoate--beta-alanine ligase [Candidatus Eisenbacteria bacterium]|nr:pantoate--beta-alanine ligase [Candidatus Eisenbacteria bacterium]